MKKLTVVGKTRLCGEVHISGAKNAALPILISSLLVDGDLLLYNLPHLTDMVSTSELLLTLGVKMSLNCDLTNINGNGKVVRYSAKNLKKYIAPYEIVSRMRASFLVLGPLLGRLGKAKVSLPGGCAIGARPVDIHLSAFEQMGAKIDIDNGYINAVVKNKSGKLEGANITFRLPSVGATENVMMAATLAKGTTVINNAAREPEIIDLANCLRGMGAKISGDGTETITIKGVDKLNSSSYTVMGDRVEAATYMIGAAMTDGDLIIQGLDIFSVLGSVVEKLKKIGVSVEKINDKTYRVRRKEQKLQPIDIVTAVFPGYPTDVQAQMMALLSIIEGESMVDETIFENRFMHIPELNRMGTSINILENKAIIKGKPGCLKNAEVMATDLRASVALALAAMCAEGESTIHRVYHFERGYEFLTDKLNKCGAKLRITWKNKLV